MKKNPEFTQDQWEILWNLLYNVTINNSHLDESGAIELNPEREDGAHILDPLSLEEINELSLMEEQLWNDLDRGPR